VHDATLVPASHVRLSVGAPTSSHVSLAVRVRNQTLARHTRCSVAVARLYVSHCTYFYFTATSTAPASQPALAILAAAPAPYYC
jgi:hypothetical protein